MNREEIAWCAGFFDGEGHTGCEPNGYIRISVSQVNRQPLERLQAAWGCGIIRFQRSNRVNQNDFFTVTVSGYERCQHVLALMWMFLSEPKRQQGTQALLKARKVTPRIHSVPEGSLPTGMRTHCPAGHEYDEQNTYRYKGKRACKKCRAANQRRSYQKMKTLNQY